MHASNSDAQQLVEWFRAHKRDLPWRANRDPYRVWISETMLQQTTTTAVIPYFERFLDRFPTLSSLARAEESQVLEQWAGLGYYSRARNLHKAAKALHDLGQFPTSYKALIELPGFGPYTARAVASIAFGELVGVVDGNVIRIFSRLLGEKWEWWKPSVRDQIQNHADRWALVQPSHELNQAMMELGRTVCTPKSPSCPLCPLRARCQALKKNLIWQIPKTRPRAAKEIWSCELQVQIRGGRLRLMKNRILPFLKEQWLLPLEGKKLSAAPKRFHYRHSITKYDIFVTVTHKTSILKDHEYRWVSLREIQQHVPTSFVHKAIAMASQPDGVPQPRLLRQPKESRLRHSADGLRQRGKKRQS